MLQAVAFEALSTGRSRIEYQPKISLATNRIVGVKALVPRDSTDDGIGESLRIALSQVTEWRRDFPDTPLQLSVFVSPEQWQADVVTVVRRIISNLAIDERFLSLAMSAATITDLPTAQTIATIRELKSIGIRISIDDFGTGCCRLEDLPPLAIDEISIHPTIVAGLGVDRRRTSIVSSTITQAHAMHLAVVAEGVQTGAQLDALETLGCDFAAGGYVAAPRSAARISKFLGVARDIPRQEPSPRRCLYLAC